MATVKKTIKNH